MSTHRRWLAHPRTPWVAVVLGVLAMCLSLDTGLAADDFLLQYALVGGTPLPFADVGPSGLPELASTADVHASRATGLLPWTASESFRFAFLRPLAMLTHRLDFSVWPSQPWLMHAHSVLWFGAFLTAAVTFIRRIEGPTWVAGFAALVLALDDAHGPSVGWIANRNLIMAGAFGFAALVVQHKRIDGAPAWLAPLLFVAGLASNEGTIGLWPLAMAVIGLLDPRPQKWRDAAVLAALCVGWGVLWAALGMGVHHSGIYADPSGDPVGSVVQLLTNLPILLMSATSGIWADFFSFAQPTGRRVWWLFALTITAIATVIGVRLAARDRHAAVWGIGLLGAAIPISASFPSDRLLLLVSVPAAAWLAHLLAHLRDDRRAWRVAQAVALALVVRHVGSNVLLSPLRARSMENPQALVERAWKSLDLDGAEDRVVVLLNPVSDGIPAYSLILQSTAYQPVPRGLHTLYSGTASLSVERLDATTLRLRPATAWMAVPSERLSRDVARQPFIVGDRVVLNGLSIVVDAVTSDGRPAQTTVTFDRPLEDPLYRWHAWDVIDMRPVTPPAIGETLVLPPTDPVKAFFGIED